MSAPETDLAPIAHPGADFDVTEEREPPFLVFDGPFEDADCIDVPVIGEVDENGVVRWGGER